MDDSDIISALKLWQANEDKILSLLSQFIIQRKLPFSCIISEPISKDKLLKLENATKELFDIEDGKNFVHQKDLSVLAYNDKKDPIKLLLKNGEIIELQKADNQVLVKDLRKKITRYHLCMPREIYGVK